LICINSCAIKIRWRPKRLLHRSRQPWLRLRRLGTVHA
jgi:hypothetical protein